MNGNFKIDPEMSIDEIMRRWPGTINIILLYDMHCVGCLLAPFHASIDAAIEHSVDIDEFLVALTDGITAPKDP